MQFEKYYYKLNCNVYKFIINYFRILLLLIFLFTYSILCQEYDCEKCKIGDETCDVTKCSECGNNLKFFHKKHSYLLLALVLLHFFLNYSLIPFFSHYIVLLYF